MDLTSIMRRDAAIVDHEWMKSKGGLISRGNQPLLDVEGITNPNNTKPELEVQWGGGTGPDFEFADQEDAGVVERDLDGDGDVDDVVIFARRMMNKGLMGRDLNRALRNKFAVETLKKASDGLSNLFNLEGIIGCIAVDGRGYENCRTALDDAKLSPYKAHIKYVIGCNCGTPHTLPKNAQGPLLGMGSTTGNAVDDFFASDNGHEETLISHCRSTMLPILSSDLDPSEVDSGIIDLMTTTELPQDVAEEVKKQKGMKAMQAAFKWLQRAREARQDAEYAASVDVSEHILKPSEPVVEINDPVAGQIEVDARNPANAPTIAIDGPPPSTTFDGMQDLGSEIIAELADIQRVNPLDVALGSESDIPQFRVADKPEAPKPQEVELERISPVVVGKVSTPDVDLNRGQMQVPVNQQKRVAEQPVELGDSLGDFLFGDAPNTEVAFDNGEMEVAFGPRPTLPGPLDVAPGGLFDDIGLAPKAQAADIDMAPNLDKMFQGTDEIELEAPQGPPGELDISF